MHSASFKWGLGLVLLGMLADTISPHPLLQADEQHYEGPMRQPSVIGLANERQWLFAHRKFRNQCVLEAFADETWPSKKPFLLSARLADDIAIAQLRLGANE